MSENNFNEEIYKLLDKMSDSYYGTIIESCIEKVLQCCKNVKKAQQKLGNFYKEKLL